MRHERWSPCIGATARSTRQPSLGPESSVRKAGVLPAAIAPDADRAPNFMYGPRIEVREDEQRAIARLFDTGDRGEAVPAKQISRSLRQVELIDRGPQAR